MRSTRCCRTGCVLLTFRHCAGFAKVRRPFRPKRDRLLSYDSTKMTKLTALRLYFHHSAKAHPTRLWHRISRPSLAHHLLRHAKRAGIEQAVFHRVHAGYLGGDRLHHSHAEHVHHRFPHCIELIDREHKLRDFWHAHGRDLQNVRAIFMPCEPAGNLDQSSLTA
ncbi:DUF190 domain-containing protein [Burkholderia pseudomultivorans]|uniref:DUF190 domain-containing protein n=2 Tax=Burkholderia TaxID=32008 RepID=UPI0012D92961